MFKLLKKAFKKLKFENGKPTDNSDGATDEDSERCSDKKEPDEERAVL